MVVATHKTKRFECEQCHGLGYKEFESGLIRTPCKRCDGTSFITKEVKIGGNRTRSART